MINSEYLKEIKEAADIIIPASNGRSLVTATNVFSHIDSDIPDVVGMYKDETQVIMYEQVGEPTLIQLFGSISLDLEILCWEPGQILTFAEKHGNWLTMGPSLFMFVTRGKFVIVGMKRHRGDNKITLRFYDLREANHFNQAIPAQIIIPKIF